MFRTTNPLAAPRTRLTWKHGRIAGILLASALTGVGAYMAMDALAPAPEPQVHVVTVTDSACSEAVQQLAAYSADATATLDTIVYLYDQGVEYDASINGDNVIPLRARLGYLESAYVSACLG